VEGQKYAVTFRTESMLKGPFECTLLKDGKTTKAYEVTYASPKLFTPIRLLLSLAVIVGINILLSYFKLPMWVGLSVVALVAVVLVKIRKKGGFSIEEITT